MPPDDWLSRHPKDVLGEHGIRASRGLGQSFLIRSADLDNVAEAAQVTAEETVLEIGTGLGRLTARIAQRAARVVTVEIDARLHAIAAANLAATPNVALLCGDFLKSKHRISPAVTEAVRAALQESAAGLKVVSNLPYGISSPAIVNLLEWEVPPGEMCLMVQKEVAERLSAAPGGGDYGPLTVFVDYWATVEELLSLPPSAFWPAPQVSSRLLRITRRGERDRLCGYPAFAAVVRKLFETRRKSLGKILRVGWGREAADRALDGLGIDPMQRPEELSTADFEALAAELGPPNRG
ncbi:MAG: 16S rRNA (adenine(1518)-N(6)/adenine(1519)-N(6))-dimethyltransferase RsmA [Planctomycetota bacterium]|jgi:16S rRNA (adenine1518-N6/adenine1519-N6)-dimethyltransferase